MGKGRVNGSIADDLIKYEIIKATFFASRRLARRWRQGLRPIWAGLFFAILGTVAHLLSPSFHWVFLLLSLLCGGSVAIFGEKITGPLARLAPSGLDTGEEDTLDGTGERVFVSLLLTYSFLWTSLLADNGWDAFIFYAWIVGLAVFGGSWWLHQKVRITGRAGKYSKRWYRLTQKVADFEGSTCVGGRGTGGSVKLLVQLPKGKTGKSVFGSHDEVASFYGLRSESVQIHQAPENARRVVVTIIPRDPWNEVIRHPLPEPGTLALSESSTFPMGVDSSGGKHKYDLQHTLIVGQSESGKSVWVESLLIYLSSCRDVVLLGIDMASGATLSPWEDVFALPVATDSAKAMDLLAHVLSLVKAREQRLAEMKRVDPSAPDFFVPSEEDPWVVLFIDEHPDLVAEGGALFNNVFGRIMKRSRKAGVRVISAAQNGSKEDIGSKEAQGQFKATVGFLVDEHSSKVLWKQLHTTGWATSSLKQGQYKIRDPKNRVPVVYKGYFATSAERSAHRLKASVERPRLSEEDWEALTAPPLPPEEDEMEQHSVRPQVMAIMEEVGKPISAKWLAERLAVTLRTAYNHLNAMKDAGEVTNSKGRWQIVEGEIA